MPELSHNEAEERFSPELRGLPISALAQIVVKCCRDGSRREIYEDDYGLRTDGRRPDGAIPKEIIWHHTIMGVPLEMHYYIRSPSRLILKHKAKWSVSFSTSIMVRGSVNKHLWVTMELDRALLPKDTLIGMRGGMKVFRAFSFKRKGNTQYYLRDMSVLRLTI